MKKQSLDLNNNSASLQLNSNPNKTTTSNQQLKFTKQNLYTSSSPPNLISTIQETETELIKPTSIYTRPPVLKHQIKNNSISSNSTSSSAITNSFDSNSIENLPNIYRTDSYEKLLNDRILRERIHQATQSQSKFNKTHGKIPKLSGNFIENKINTQNLSKFFLL